MAREDLNPVEEARACAGARRGAGPDTREDVGRRVGRSRVAVSNLIRLLDLPDEALELMERGELSEGHGRALLLAEDHDVRRRLARDAAAAGWSVRELERRARAAADERPARPRDAAEPPASRPGGGRRAARRRLRHRARRRGLSVAPQGDGYRVELDFDSLDEALELAGRARRRDARLTLARTRLARRPARIASRGAISSVG